MKRGTNTANPHWLGCTDCPQKAGTEMLVAGSGIPERGSWGGTGRGQGASQQGFCDKHPAALLPSVRGGSITLDPQLLLEAQNLGGETGVPCSGKGRGELVMSDTSPMHPPHVWGRGTNTHTRAEPGGGTFGAFLSCCPQRVLK